MEQVPAPRAFVRTVALSLLALPMAPVLPAAERSYRADANIVFLGVTLLSRSGVGGGFARLTETSSGGRTSVRLLFVSGSLPDRAHGLNRMGYIEESISESNARPDRAEYLGFMTASGEDSLAGAKKALHGPTADEVLFVASRGRIDGALARHTVRRMLLPASLRWTDAQNLLGRVEEDLALPGNAKSADPGPGERPGTFLYTVLNMVRSPNQTTDGAFLHNGKLFHLHAAKRPDQKAGAVFVQDRLMASSRGAMELDGLIRNVKTGVETTFRVWFDRSSPNPLPLRFEFQPKSYLRLVFEAEPAEDPEVVKSFPEPAPSLPSPNTAFSRAAFR
jgi:hypothetical protein